MAQTKRKKLKKRVESAFEILLNLGGSAIVIAVVITLRYGYSDVMILAGIVGSLIALFSAIDMFTGRYSNKVTTFIWRKKYKKT